MSSNSAEHIEAGDLPDGYLTSTMVSGLRKRGGEQADATMQMALLIKTGEQASGGGAEADRIISNVF